MSEKEKNAKLYDEANSYWNRLANLMFRPLKSSNASQNGYKIRRIPTMDEQSYVYDEENHKSVYKKMFATMSDCASVNKKFNLVGPEH